MNKERLLRLADLLETVPKSQFDMRYWARLGFDGKPDPPCGTTACAMGWATTIPEFQSAGLHLYQRVEKGSYPVIVPVFGEHEQFRAAARFFEITTDESFWLFDPDWYSVDGEDEEVTPKTVAGRIRSLVEGTDGPEDY